MQCFEEREDFLRACLDRLSGPSGKPGYPLVKFRPITAREFQAQPTAVFTKYGGRGNDCPEGALQYKILKSEAKLVQSVLEGNGKRVERGVQALSRPRDTTGICFGATVTLGRMCMMD